MYQNNAHSYRGPVWVALITVVVIAAMVYLTTAIGSRDLLWFWSEFDEQPASATVRCGGREAVFAPDDPIFDEFVSEFNRLMSAKKRWDSLSLSDVTEAEYQTNADWVIVLLKYSPPVRIHSEYPYFSGVDTLIVPLVGRHADTAAVFGKTGSLPNSGAFHLSSNETLLRILTNNGVCAAG